MNARARNTHVEATLNHPFPAQAGVADVFADPPKNDDELRAAVERRAGLGRKRVIQRRFNVAVPRARVPKKDVHGRDRSER